MRIIGIVLMCLFLFIPNVSALDMSLTQENMCNTIAEAMNKHPDLWIVKSYDLIYASDLDTINGLYETSYPENDSAAELVLQYHLYHTSEHVHIEKPFDMKFKGKYKDKLIREIKKMMYKKLRDEVGYEVAKEEQNKPKEAATVKDLPVEEKKIGDMNRL